MSVPFNFINNEIAADALDHVKKIKAPPQSCFETEECSSNYELSRICFSGSFPVVEVSCSSSDSAVSIGSEVSVTESLSIKAKTVGEDGDVLCSYMQDGTCLQVNKSSESRQGRDHQRWDKVSDASSSIRLVTGSVPITNDGRVVFVSSARKKQWILPKGGWESDESLEESALRETFEESGLLGILGPKLSDICFETRKAKKRRLDGLDLEKCIDQAAKTPRLCSNSSIASSEDSETNISTSTFKQSSIPTFFPPVVSCELNNTSAPPRTVVSPEEEHVPNNYAGICRMTLFPLYITNVLDTWPESGRSRKLCTIDEAINTCTRPEFKAALVEVKEKGLHLPPDMR